MPGIAVASGVDAYAPPPTPGSLPRALTSRALDFWLLGGASLVVWAALMIAQHLRGLPVVDREFRDLEATTLTLALFANYPHFLISYKLAYSRGRSFVFEHWWSLIAVPILLLAVFAASYHFFNVPVRDVAVLRRLTAWLLPWGVNAQLVAGPDLGDVLLTAAFTVMVLTIGWHYTKQVFGCLVVYAHFDGYPLSRSQRTLVKWALLSVWPMAFVDNNLTGGWKVFGDFTYSSLDLPDIAAPLTQAAVAIGLALVVYRVFYTNYRATGRLPGANMLVPLASIYVWWLPETRQNEFYFLLVPLFHSLQYLAFAYKMEATRLSVVRWRAARSTALVIGTIAAGWLAFEFVPGALDSAFGTAHALNVSFFVIAAMLFINIHHYFIDSVNWRMKDSTVREYLLG